jgi:hypothetical protein
MAVGQDWCLECGVGAPGSFGARPGWRSAAAIIAATVLLAAAAVAAGYAALTKSSSHRVVTRPAVAQVSTAPDVPPASTVAPTPTPPAAGVPPVTPPKTPTLPAITRAPTPPAAVHPAVPAPTPAPAATTPHTTPAPAVTTPTTPKKTSTISPKSAAGAAGSPVVLDPDAAGTYNPYGYPDSRFGDPSLAIDQDPTTDWSAQVDPSAAPRNATGLTLDLKSPQSLSQLKLHTVTPGMEVEIYGANGAQLPPSITDPAWHHLSPPHHVTKNTTFKLLTGGQKYRFIVLWITKAPSSSSTARMAVNEVTLFH